MILGIIKLLNIKTKRLNKPNNFLIYLLDKTALVYAMYFRAK